MEEKMELSLESQFLDKKERQLFDVLKEKGIPK